MKALKIGTFVLSVAALPLVSSAQFVATTGGTGRLESLLKSVGDLIAALIPIIMGLALIVFLWGVLLYVISKSQEDKAAARSYMIWGIIGLFVMVSVWGIVTILSDAVFGGARIDSPPVLPRFTPR
ncbi:hypothetical protein H6775_03570 [Candidatus Nomurabacteria bacterium]|nr:hypothetical protein [Candidatus Nomurabacteria bacterium]